MAPSADGRGAVAAAPGLGVAQEPRPNAGSGLDAAEAFFVGHPLALAVFHAVYKFVQTMGAVDLRTTRSQVAFRRRRGFAYLWLPGRWLKRPDAEVVLSIALDRRFDSLRFKSVVHPSPRIWMHHLEVLAIDDLDDEVRSWLCEAYAASA